MADEAAEKSTGTILAPGAEAGDTELEQDSNARFRRVVAQVEAQAAKDKLAESEAVLAEDEDDEEDDEAEAKPKAKAKPAAKEEKKAAAKEKPAKSEKAKKEEQPKAKESAEQEPTEAVSIAKAKALLKSDPLAAVRAVFGDEGVKALNVNSKAFEALRHEKKKITASFEQREQQLQNIITQVEKRAARVEKFAAAQEAFDSGDFVGAFEKAFGIEINEFQKRALRQKAGEDPRVTKLERELAEERKSKAERERVEQEQSRQAAFDREVAQHRRAIATELAESDDPRIVGAAKHPGFITRIFDLQHEHYDRDTDTTLPVAHAAELALEELLEQHRSWSEVLGAVQGGVPAKQVVRATEPVKQAPRKSAPSQSEATEASGPGRELTPEQVMAKHTRLMTLAALQEEAQRAAG